LVCLNSCLRCGTKLPDPLPPLGGWSLAKRCGTKLPDPSEHLTSTRTFCSFRMYVRYYKSFKFLWSRNQRYCCMKYQLYIIWNVTTDQQGECPLTSSAIKWLPLRIHLPQACMNELEDWRSIDKICV